MTLVKALREAVLIASLAIAPSAWAAKTRTTHLQGVLNLNQATASELDLLPGVGEKAAKRIISFREKTPFQRPEDLVKVKGFGKKRFEQMRIHLVVSGPTTLKRTRGPGGSSL